MASFPTIVPSADVARDAVQQFQDFAGQQIQNFTQADERRRDSAGG
jgi:uncharacterized protein YbjQ (UPF0145 family)